MLLFAFRFFNNECKLSIYLMAKFKNRINYLYKKLLPMKWSHAQDEHLIREVLAERPFDRPKASRQIGQYGKRQCASQKDYIFYTQTLIVLNGSNA